MKLSRNLMLLMIILLNGCGSLTPALESGNGFYSELPTIEIEKLAANKPKILPLKKEASGCFAIDPNEIENKIIAPAVKTSMIESDSYAAQNVKARRIVAPTVLDALTGAFIWGCSYWDITGDLLHK